MGLMMMGRVGDRWEKMEGSCSTGQSPPWAVVPVEEEEEEEGGEEGGEGEGEEGEGEEGEGQEGEGQEGEEEEEEEDEEKEEGLNYDNHLATNSTEVTYVDSFINCL
jgi:hypothetical protein